ncbi:MULTISPECIES: PAP/fibrillin family protein [Nostocales]|uniref:PAP/fibrillin family protein n=1 Tax=Nostocales TaxID=1161 RepID=UPI001F3325D4|nr:PAP/fibrillin family protein [Tolypothrix bouteillei]
MNEWKAIFARQKQSAKRTWKESLLSGFWKLMFGIVSSGAMNSKTGAISFTMKRSPKGRLEILYLDEEMRITRGVERGTVLVCERN